LSLDSLKGIVDEKTLEIIRVLYSDRTSLFSIKMVSDKSKVPIATVFRIMHSLQKNGWVDLVAVGKIKLYTLNKGKSKVLDKIK